MPFSVALEWERGMQVVEVGGSSEPQIHASSIYKGPVDQSVDSVEQRRKTGLGANIQRQVTFMRWQ